MKLPLFKCHKVVRAAKIIKVVPHDIDNGADITVDGGSCCQCVHTITVDYLWMQRNPAVAVGGYFVEYQEDDKYTTYSPAGPFEGGYTLVPGA